MMIDDDDDDGLNYAMHGPPISKLSSYSQKIIATTPIVLRQL